MRSSQHRLLAGLVTVAMLLAVALGLVTAQPARPLNGSFDRMLALRQVTEGVLSRDAGQALILMPGEGDIIAAPVTDEEPVVYIAGWVDGSALLLMRSTDGLVFDAVQYSPGGDVEQTVASGLALDRHYVVVPGQPLVISWPYTWPDSPAGPVPFTDIQVHDAATMDTLTTVDLSPYGLSGGLLAALTATHAYFHTWQPADAFLEVDLQSGAVSGPLDLLAAGDGAERVVDVDVREGTGLVLGGRINPKDANSFYSVPFLEAGGLAQQDGEPRPQAVAVLHDLGAIGEVQHVAWSHDALAAAIVASTPGDFSASHLVLTEMGFTAADVASVRADFNSCVLFTPDDQWVLFVGEDGDSLQALPVSDPLSDPQILVTDRPGLDLCEAVWQPEAPAPVNDGGGEVTGPLAAGDSVIGEITNEQYAIEYPLSLWANETVTITMERLSDNLDAFLYLYAPDGTELARNDDAPELVGDTEMNAQIRGYTAPEAGVYTVVATRFFEAEGASSGSFRLSVTSGVPEPVVEPTPTPTESPPPGARELLIDQAASGTITNENYSLDYTIDLAAGEVVTFTMLRTSGDLDPLLYLFDSGGAELASNDDAEQEVGGSPFNAEITAFTIPAAGTYTVRATRFAEQDGSSTGDFSLLATYAAGTPPPAGELHIGDVVTGTISATTFAVEYPITLSTGDTVTITMERTSGDLDSTLVLIGVGGTELLRNDDAPQQVGDTPLNAQIVNFTAPHNGRYVIRATRFAEAQGTSTGDFRLSISSVQGGTPPPVPGAISAGDVVTGQITGAVSSVDYSIVLTAGDTVTITMERTSGDLDGLLLLYAPDGTEIAVSDDALEQVGDTPLNPQITSFLAPMSGTYRIVATRFGGAEGLSTGDFRLSVTGEQQVPPTPPPAANMLVPGTPVTGRITDDQPRILYTVALQSGQQVTITMTRQSDDLDSYLVLYGPDNLELARNDDAETQVGNTALNAQIAGFVAPVTGQYAIEATRFAQESGESTGLFEVRVDTGGGTTDVDMSAGGLIRVGDTVTGEITTQRPAVEYQVTLSAGQQVTITMQAESGDLDALLILVDPSGIEVIRNDDAETQVGESAFNAQIAGYVVPATGLYTITATRYGQENGATLGRFTLSVTGGEQAAVLSPGEALTVGGEVRGEITAVQPVVEHPITLAAGQSITITMVALSGDLDAYLSLVDSNGVEVAFNDDAAVQVGNSSYNAQITGFSAPSGGTYIIRTTRYQQTEGTSTGRYLLSVTPASTVGDAGASWPVVEGVAQAGDLSVGDTVRADISGEVYAVEFAIELAAGQPISVSMIAASGSDLDPLLVLYNPGNEAVAYNDDAPQPVGDSEFNAQIVSYTAQTSGTYVIFATRYDFEDGETTGPFDLTVSTAQAVIAEDGGAVTVGGTATGALTAITYAVDYTVTLQAGETITVSMEALDGNLDPTLVIMDQAGNELAFNDDAETEVGDSALNSQIAGFSPPAAGTYIIRATRFFEEGGSSSGRFLLTVEPAASDEAGPSK